MHLNKTATNARMREGTYGTIVAHAKKIIKNKINKCPTCLKTSKQHTNFDPPLGPPRFLSLLESSSPVFLGISFDVLGPLKFLLRRGARGKSSVSKGYALIAICLLTKYTTFYLMEGCKRQDLEVALSTHCAKFRAQKFLLTYHGPSSDIITSQDSIIELLGENVSIKILPASHQFLTTIESTIRVFNGINRTIGFGVPSEEPLKTRAEISMIYSHIANVLNSRELVVNSNQLCKPFLSNADQELILSKFLQ